MKQLKSLELMFMTLFVAMLTLSFTACDDDSGNHDYFTAIAHDSNGEFYWVIDMDNQSGAGYNGSFKINAWDKRGNRLPDKGSWSGKYNFEQNGYRIYITWSHQSLNTTWRFSDGGIAITDDGNPSAIKYLHFYPSFPEFEK